jgi:broad specificity phosphatase PhoE
VRQSRDEGCAIPSILLIRHAQASFGEADYDVLSERGRAQVEALVAGLERRRIVPDRVISGDLRRQRDTAEPCARPPGRAVTIDARWNEYDDRDILTHHASVPAGLERRPGEETLSSREFQQILSDALREWIAAGSSGPSREPWPRFQGRVTAALGDVARVLRKGETALVVSSGGAIAAITAALLGLPPEALVAFNHVSVNTGITKLVVGRSGTTLVSSNEHAHLDEADGSLISYR